MLVSIKWNSSPTSTHVAVFAKSVVGVRVVVETFDGPWELPARVESGKLGVMLKALLDPAGRYRLNLGTLAAVESQIESLFDAEPVTQAEVEPLVHPTFAPFLAAIAPAGSVHAAANLS